MMSVRRISLAVGALLVLTIGGSQGALAKSGVPFHATMAETFKVVPCGAKQVCITLVGSGQATTLGKTSEASHVVLNLLIHPGPTPDCHLNKRKATLSDASGDHITLTITGHSCETGATTVATGISRDSYVVTGGTGRYSGATGHGTDTVYIDNSTGTSATVFSGTLSTPGSL